MFRSVLNLTSCLCYLLRVLWLIVSKIISRVQSAQHIRPFYVAIGKQGKEDDSDIVTKLGENEVAIKNQRSLLGGVTDRKSHVHVPCGAEVHYPFPSVREYRMSQLSAEQKDALAAQRRIQKKAFEFISKALELDEGTTGLEFNLLEKLIDYSAMGTMTDFLESVL